MPPRNKFPFELRFETPFTASDGDEGIEWRKINLSTMWLLLINTTNGAYQHQMQAQFAGVLYPVGAHVLESLPR